jgi:RNA polymerase sigma factor (sigma-70 family)
LTDTELISLLIQKNEAVFKQLVETYQHKVYNTCIGILQNGDDAEEIAQDVFIEVFHSVHKFDQKSSLSTWIYRISINKSLDKLRHTKRKKRSGIIVPKRKK